MSSVLKTKLSSVKLTWGQKLPGMESVWMTAAHLLLFLLLLPDFKIYKVKLSKAINFLINADVFILTIALLSFKDPIEVFQ